MKSFILLLIFFLFNFLKRLLLLNTKAMDIINLICLFLVSNKIETKIYLVDIHKFDKILVGAF